MKVELNRKEDTASISISIRGLSIIIAAVEKCRFMGDGETYDLYMKFLEIKKEVRKKDGIV